MDSKVVQELAEALQKTTPETMIVFVLVLSPLVLCLIIVVMAVVTVVVVVVVVRRIDLVHVAELDPPGGDLADSAEHGIGALILSGQDHIVTVGARAPGGSAEPEAKVLVAAAVAVGESQREGTPGEVAVVDWTEADHGQRNRVDRFRVLGDLLLLLNMFAFDEGFGFKLDRIDRIGFGFLGGQEDVGGRCGGVLGVRFRKRSFLEFFDDVVYGMREGKEETDEGEGQGEFVGHGVEEWMKLWNFSKK
ncbi:hypothetical protein PanWU01x14_260630 [Parasponia andersonii]|uniref:Transmembrane protein n=1 Tax=Parasponia andersonii TaxID=3476 RepID=A0A2P5B8W3_PARAD|nr:hypothetical protein PanWU01x14_260630 [Parasponia andersonii]